MTRAAETAGPAPRLVSTKLHRPEVRRDIIDRPDLLGRLGSLDARVTLVAAPAGWGKTTFIASWQRWEPGRRFAWVSLDDGDGDPVRFWSYVSASVAEVARIADPVRDLLTLPAIDIESEIVPVLVNHWAQLESRVVLVLDDYHLVEAPEIHKSLSRLVEALPRQVRLVVASRRDPPLPLERWRVRGQLQELRADSLAFTAEETGQLLNGVLGLSLAPKQIAGLHQRTEGWAAALHLAALSWRGRPPGDRQLPELSGDNRHLVDYLTAEVLAGQSPELRTFLLHTSVLRRLCGDLCDAVTGQERSYAVLETVEREGLPIVPLDQQRCWYRYHHLFGELLGRELRRADPAVVAELHRRAARWYEQEGLIAEAIEHLLAAAGEADRDRAAELVAEHWVEYFNRGLYATVDAWLEALPAAAWLSHPELVLSRVWIALDTAHLPDVDRWIDAAEQRGSAQPHVLSLLRALHRFKSGDLADALSVLESTGPPDATTTDFYRTVGACLRGVVAFWSGQPAEEHFATAAQVARADNNELGELYAVGYLAILAMRNGQRERATRLLRRADSLAAGDAALHFVAMAASLGRALLLEQSSDMAGAHEAAASALRVSRGGAGMVELIAVLATVGRLRAVSGDTTGARAAETEARRLMAGCPDVGIAGEWLQALSHRVAGSRHPVQVSAGDELSERELEVLRLLPTELSVKRLSDALYVSPNTVKTHLRNIFRKLDVTSREAAVLAGRGVGLL